MDVVIKGVVTIWLAAVSLWDLRTHQVPNPLVLPVMIILGIWRLGQTLLIWFQPHWPPWLDGGARVSPALVEMGQLAAPALPWIVWALLFGLWYLDAVIAEDRLVIMGGGDVKLLMALFVLFPTLEFAFLLCLFIVLLGTPLAIIQLFKGRRADRDVTSQPTLRPYAWLFCLPGVIYTWLFW